MRICFLFCLFLSSLSIGAQGILPFNNSDLPVEERAQDLLQRLTLQEKVLLMCDYSSPIPRLGIKRYNWWNEALHGVGRAGLATVFPQVWLLLLMIVPLGKLLNVSLMRPVPNIIILKTKREANVIRD